MSELAKAFVTFLILAALSIVLIQIGQRPDTATSNTGTSGANTATSTSLFQRSLVQRPLSFLSSAVALPHNIFVASTANVRNYLASVSQRHDQEEVIANLQEEVATLKSEQRQLELQLENYRQVLGVRVFQSSGVIGTADVIGISSGRLQNTMTLNKGKNDSVVKNMPITVPEGLVGIVTEVSERRSVVRTILDPSSRVGVTVQGKAGQGIAVGQLDGNLRIIDYFQQDTVKVGDLVETQSRKGLFPRGLPVGTVIQVLDNDPNSLTTEFIVKPAADIQNILAVSLIKPL